MAKTKKREIGDTGEGVVCRYLEGKGYTVVERNYWKPWGEIDIVATKDEITIFVEVKTVSHESGEESGSRGTGVRSGDYAVRPEDNMHPAKVKRLHRAIQTYLLERKVPEDRPWRLDLACAYLDFSTHTARVEMLENIVL